MATPAPRSLPVLAALAPLLCLAPALTCVAPRIMAALYLACGTLAVAAHAYQHRRLPRISKYWLLAVGGFTAYGALGQVWTINPEGTLGKAFSLGYGFLVSGYLLSLLLALDARAKRVVGLMLMGGTLFGFAVYLFEYLNNFPLYDLVRGGESEDVRAVRQNKPAFLLTMWALLCLPFVLHEKTRMAKALFALCLPAAYIATFTSMSDSGQVILYGLPVLAATLYLVKTRHTLRLALTGMLLILATMPILAMGIYNYVPWKNRAYVTSSIQSRIEIWNQSANRTSEKPWFGWGLDSARNIPNRGEVTSKLYDKMRIQVAHLHPHNAPLQIWFELGAAGIAGVAALFIMFFMRIERLTSVHAQRYAVFMWSIMFLYTLSIWGIWQSWFIASLCFTGVMAAWNVRMLESQHKQ